jgi:lipopolysaccharide export system protein LptC
MADNMPRNGTAVPHKRPSGAAASPIGKEAFAHAQRHSRRVRAFKIALPVLALVMAAGFAAYSWVSSPISIGIDIAGSSMQDGKLVMANPKLDGYTSDNRRYTMTAMRAIQEAGSDAIDLETIRARLPIEDEMWASIQAPFGRFHRGNNLLEIPRSMMVETSDGMVARLKSATIDIDAGTLTSQEPVEITMAGSRVTADTLSIMENGKVLVFDQRVRVDISPEKLKTAEATGGGDDASN